MADATGGPQRQTFTYLRNLFGKRGISPNRPFGQNFLIDLNIHELIVKTAELTPDDVVLEVGPGAGALTTLMAEQASAVVSVEIDAAMSMLTQQAVEGRANVRVINMDALASKHRLNEYVLDNLKAGLAMGPEKRLKLVANLPYNVATPIITNLLVHDELRPVLVVVTIQKELADRMVAQPLSPHYGALSVLIQMLGEIEIVRVLNPKVFWPRPKVDSAIIKITPSAEKRAAIPDLKWFQRVVREIFTLRRKNLRGVLWARWRKGWNGKADVDAFLEELGLVGEVRAEAMDGMELLALAEALRARFGAEDGDEELEDAEEDEDQEAD